MQKDNIPKHIGIIMDGNRRWAKRQGLKILCGHQKAAEEVIEPLIEKAGEMGVRYLTFWCFSTENWQRQKEEIRGLFEIFRFVIKNKLQRMKEKGARIKVLGNLENFPQDIKEGVERAERETIQNRKITVNFALGYGGRDEIVRAVNKWFDSKRKKIKKQGGELDKKGVEDYRLTEEEFGSYLDTAGQPDPDLIIRTGGEKRLSGFLTWQSVYSELYFTDTLFPDFTKEDLMKAIQDYQTRKRRFGK